MNAARLPCVGGLLREDALSSNGPAHSGAMPLLLRTDFLGGLTVIAVGALAYWLGSDLAVGTLGGMGPGMLPQALSVLLAALGLLLLVNSFRETQVRLTIGSLRGPILVFAALIAFGLTIRPLGLIAAGPLAIVIGAFASSEVKWVETLVCAIVTAAFCILLFKFALGLPIPLAPWLIGY